MVTYYAPGHALPKLYSRLLRITPGLGDSKSLGLADEIGKRAPPHLAYDVAPMDLHGDLAKFHQASHRLFIQPAVT